MGQGPGPLIVSGAAGFVGTNLCRYLAGTGRPFRPLPGADVTTGWRPVLEGGDALVHLLARPSGDAAEQAATLALTESLALQARQVGLRRLVFVSTAKVYGETSPTGHACVETDRPKPVGAYAEGKLAAEVRLREILGAALTIVRVPLVHGPGVKRNFAMLLRAVERGWPLPLARVENRRSLISAASLAHFLVLAAEHPAASGEVFNVADEDVVSTRRLLGALAAAMGRPDRQWAFPPSWLDGLLRAAGRGSIADRLLHDLVLDVSKARLRLGWSPPLGFEAGIAQTVGDYLDRRRSSP